MDNIGDFYDYFMISYALEFSLLFCVSVILSVVMYVCFRYIQIYKAKRTFVPIEYEVLYANVCSSLVSESGNYNVFLSLENDMTYNRVYNSKYIHSQLESLKYTEVYLHEVFNRISNTTVKFISLNSKLDKSDYLHMYNSYL